MKHAAFAQGARRFFPALGLAGLALALPTGCASASRPAPMPPPASPPPVSTLMSGAGGKLPLTINDWDGGALRQVEFVEPVNLLNYDRVVVEPFDAASAPLPPAGDSAYVDVIDTLRDSRRLFIAGMKTQWHAGAQIVAEPVATILHPQPLATSEIVTYAVAEPAVAPATAPMPRGSSPKASRKGTPREIPTTMPSVISPPAVPHGAAALPRTLLLRIAVTRLDPGRRAERPLDIRLTGDTTLALHGELIDAPTGQVLLRFDDITTGTYGRWSNPYVRQLRRQLTRAGQAAALLIESLDNGRVKYQREWSAVPGGEVHRYSAAADCERDAAISLATSR